MPRLKNHINIEVDQKKEFPRMKILAMGGSIESTVDDFGLKRVDSDLLEKYVDNQTFPLLIEFKRIVQVASHNLSMKEIYLLINELINIEDGVIPVITTGTDTLEEIAFLAALFNPPTGVVIMATLHDGSQERVHHLFSNLFKRLLHHSSIFTEPIVIVDEKQFRAANFTEELLFLGEQDYQQSGSKSYPELLSGDERVRILKFREMRSPSVSVISSLITNPLTQINEFVDQGEILILQGFGMGNTTKDILQAVTKRIEKGKSTILVTAHPAIALKKISVAEGGNAHLLNIGVWNGSSLSPRKVALLASLLYHFEFNGKEPFERISKLMSEL